MSITNRPINGSQLDTQTPSDTIPQIDSQTKSLVGSFAETFDDDAVCYPFLLADEEITPRTVDKVFDDLQASYDAEHQDSHLVVIVDSGGGDIDAAYNLALLFRTYGKKKLTYVVPRWAKSAATLLVCSGDSVMMTPVAELGPLDPQITEVNHLEQRLERFSPLHIESTLELIRNEFDKGNKELAEGLLQRLQFPITLGSFKKSLEVGKQYANKLLLSRMLKDNEELASEISGKLVEAYADHGFCINVDEAEDLGLVIEKPSNKQLKAVWEIHKLARKRADLVRAKREEEMKERLKDLPPGILDGLSHPIINQEPRNEPKVMVTTNG